MTPEVRIRAAGPDDVGTVFSLIGQLAAYERLAHELKGSEAMLADGMFGADANVEALLAETDSDALGFALFFHTFSTFECRRGVWLEDLFVVPEHRRGGIGRKLLAELASIAIERNCARLEWAALDWNAPALEFYAGFEARVMEEWKILRLEGEALQRLGRGVGT